MNPPHIHVVSGLALQDGKILMGKRKLGKLRPELWELPGGKVEPGESYQMAMAREWHEELGFKIVVGKHLMPAIDLDLVDQVFVLHLFAVDAWSGKFPVMPKPIDHSELRWVDHAEAMRYLPCSPGYYLQYRGIDTWVKAGNGRF